MIWKNVSRNLNKILKFNIWNRRSWMWKTLSDSIDLKSFDLNKYNDLRVTSAGLVNRFNWKHENNNLMCTRNVILSTRIKSKMVTTQFLHTLRRWAPSSNQVANLPNEIPKNWNGGLYSLRCFTLKIRVVTCIGWRWRIILWTLIRIT